MNASPPTTTAEAEPSAVPGPSAPTRAIAATVPGERHLLQLDGLRALAVLAVMVEHWMPDRFHLFVPWGSAGVRLFFVLSGFLITGILLRARDDAAAAGQSVGVTLRQFYARRFLRIFPLYYLAVIVAAFAVVEGRQTLVVNLLYLTNVDIFLKQRLRGAVTHFWSLAVEEQFYLVWPPLLLLMPRAWTRGVIVATIVAAIVFRVAFALLAPKVMYAEFLPIACADALGLGAMLAFVRGQASGARRFERLCLFVGLPLWIALRACAIAKVHVPLLATLELTAMSLVFTWVISRAAVGFAGIVGRVLTFGLLVYLGTISYGLYVLHNLVWPALVSHLHFWPMPGIAARLPLKFSLLLIVTIVLASVSWWLYERPINALKRYIPYVRRTRLA